MQQLYSNIKYELVKLIQKVKQMRKNHDQLHPLHG